jgi:MFS family permease
MKETNTAASPRFAALKHRNFRYFWLGLIVSNIGTWMQNVAQGWLVLQLTNSPLWLGLLGLSFALPMVLLPFLGGVVVDRINRIKLLYFTQTGMMLTALILAVLTWTHYITVWYILAASFIGAVFLAFDNPARQALVPDMVPPRDLMSALSLNSALYTGAALIGPAIAGILLGPLGAGALFFINGISYFSMIFAVAALKDIRTHGGDKADTLGRSAAAGLAYAWQTRFILLLLLLSSVAAIFGWSYQSLFPVFARDIWHSGEKGYGLLLSAGGGGALIGAFGLAAMRQLKRHGAVMVISGIIFSISVILFAVSPDLLSGVFFLFIGGVAITITGTIIVTFIQLAVPNELRGRIMSLYSITLIGLPALGALGSGAAAEMLGGLFGAPHAVLIGGIVVGVIILLLTPFFWKRTVEVKKREI